MSAQLLELDPNTPDRSELLGTIMTSTQRAADLVRQILTFARGTDGRRVPVQPRYLLGELRKILNETLPKSIHLTTDIAPDAWPVNGDSTQLGQVLMNLCLNARDAMPQGGELTVIVSNFQLDEQFATADGEAKPGPYVIITVTDTGIGMPPPVRERIFDPFFTTKEVGKGTGLGLSTALGIVKSHGGIIRVHSEPGRGSTFKVYLPALADVQATAPTPSKDESSTIRGNNELVLLVDDEEAVRSLGAQTLKRFGYRVMTANDGMQAVALYTQHRKEIDLVITDIMMPVMDGAAAIQAMVEFNPEVKIIASSGLVNQGGPSSNVNLPIQGYLPKPYTTQKILQIVHEVLHGPKTASSRY